MQWTRVDNTLVITDRQRSGYDYRARQTDRGVVILIAEGGVTSRLPMRRQECPDLVAAMTLADQWESDG